MTTSHSKPPRILIIEDNPADIAWLHIGLDEQKEIYDLEVLFDGEAALRFVEEHRTGARDPDPCVIVLDLHLPKYDGIEVLRAIKRAPVLAHIHVVVMSSSPSPRDEAEIIRLGALFRLKPSALQDCLALACEIIEICKGSLVGAKAKYALPETKGE